MPDFTSIFSFQTILQTLIRAVVLFTALPVHEAAHAWVANKLGDPTGRYQGRITLNPFAHLDLLGSICILLTGFGWAKPVPVNPNNFKNRKVGMALTSAAGPLSNLLFAYVLLIVEKIIMGVAGIGSVGMVYFLSVIVTMISINLGLAVFNLLPIPPLDGSRLATLFLPERYYFKLMQYEQIIFIGLILLLTTGILNKPLQFLTSLLYAVINFLSGFVDLLFGLL